MLSDPTSESNMDWYSGDVAQCIRTVKNEHKLLLVFSKDNENGSGDILAILNKGDVVQRCQNVICLQLQPGSVPYQQFSSVYQVPSLPCIHIIAPSGTVLATKSSDFSEDHIFTWISETMEKFEASEKDASDNIPSVARADTAQSVASSDGTEDLNITEAHKSDHDDEASNGDFETIPSPPQLKTETASPTVDDTAAQQSDSSYHVNGENDDTSNAQSSDTVEGNGPSDEKPNSSMTLEERVKHARRLLEEKQNEKAVKTFQEEHEAEIRRRELGHNLAEFKRMKQEQEIRERLEEQQREKKEREETRRRLLAQIELDKRERMSAAAAAKTAVAPKPMTRPFNTNSNEVRLQLRLPDGAYMVGVFSSDAHLGTEVRGYIRRRVEAKSDTEDSELAAMSKGAPPLSDAARASFAPVIAAGFTFRQLRPTPRNFSADDETSKTLRELDLWPSAVLVLERNDGVSQGPVASYSPRVVSSLIGFVWSGLQTVGNALVYLGGGILQVGQSAWQLVFGGVDVPRSDGRTEDVTGSDLRRSPPPPLSSGSRSSRDGGDTESGTTAYRRQGKISRLSHMPDDSDEQARWNGNSTTQLKLGMTAFIRLWDGYLKLLLKYPVRTQAISTAFIMGGGDIICQKIVERREKWDVTRAVKFGGIGLLVVGPALNFWYSFLDKLYKGQSTIRIVKMVVTDQLVMAPCLLSTIIGLTGYTRSWSIQEAKDGLSASFLSALKTNYMVWFPTQFINFTFVPVHFRLLMVNVVAMFWNSFLSFVSQNKQKAIKSE